MSTIKAANLFYENPAENSDKEYHVQLVKEGEGYLVNFQYGRKGGNLTNGTKTETPIALDKAEKIFNKVVAEKTGKGYQEK